jgi:hypothetical protein
MAVAIGPPGNGTRWRRASALTEGECQAERGGVGGRGTRKSGRPTDVAMMQATNFGDLDDHADLWPRDRPRVGCILVEREVSSRLVIVGEVAGQRAAQVQLRSVKCPESRSRSFSCQATFKAYSWRATT